MARSLALSKRTRERAARVLAAGGDVLDEEQRGSRVRRADREERMSGGQSGRRGDHDHDRGPASATIGGGARYAAASASTGRAWTQRTCASRARCPTLSTPRDEGCGIWMNI